MFGPKLSLAVRTQVIISVTLLVVFSVGLYLSLRALEASFMGFERMDSENQLSRAAIVIAEKMRSLESFATDYGKWDDTADFARGRRPGYTAENFLTETYENIDTDFILVLGLDGRVLYEGMRSRQYPGTAISPGALRKDGLSDISNGILNRIRGISVSVDTRPGLIEADGATIMVGIFPIMATSGKGPSYGAISMGKVLDRTVIAEYSARAQTGMSVKAVSSAAGNKNDAPEFLPHQWKAHQIIPGLVRGETFRLTAFGERHLLHQLSTSRWLLILNLLAMAVVCVAMVGMVLHRTVLKRISEFALRADRLRKGHDVAIRMPTGKDDDELDYLAVSINDLLDELQSTQRQLLNDAQHDNLTGLGNRSFLMNRLGLACALRERNSEYRFALYLIDLDGFKNINDAFGHNTGDQVLRVIADRIISHVRHSDTAVRLGGDEFVILQMDSGGLEDCEAFACRLLGSIAEPFQCDSQTLEITASMGVCLSLERPGECVPAEMLRDADIAMYTAKQEGKNRHNIFCSELGSAVTERLSLAHDLKGAIEQGELEVWYQPIISIDEGRVAEVEALVRWRHPKRGLIRPDLFIHLAEESPAIIALDRWVMVQALAGIRRMREIAPDISVSVNVSIRNFLQPDLHGVITSALEAAGLPPQALSVELTETDLARNEIALVGPIRKLADMGVRCLLDDFGSGYSSLGRLDLLPVHILKMDRAFIRRIDGGDIRIVEAVITMAHALGKKVVAEGVETDLQVEVLQSLECDLFQGFRFARPMPEASLLKLLKKGIRSFNRAGALN